MLFTSAHQPVSGRFRILALTAFLAVSLLQNAAAQVSVNGPLTIEVELAPGAVHSGTVILENTGTRTEDVKLYQTDYRAESPTRYFYDEPDSHPRSNASWITITPLRFSIPAGARYAVPYTIDVPVDVDLSGTYWSVLMIEPIPEGSRESTSASLDEIGVGMVTILRYALRFVTHVGEDGTFQPEVTGARLELHDDRPTLAVALANAGTRMLRIEIWAELYDERGQIVARREGSGGTLFPGSSTEYRVALDDVPADTYTALVLVDCGRNNVFGVSLSLTIK